MSYTNGELQALVAPLFGLVAEQVREVVIIIRTDYQVDTVQTTATDDRSRNRAASLKLIGCAVQGYAEGMQEDA